MRLASKNKDAKLGVFSMNRALETINTIKHECDIKETGEGWKEMDKINKANLNDYSKFMWMPHNGEYYFNFHNITSFMKGVGANWEKKEFGGMGWEFARGLYEQVNQPEYPYKVYGAAFASGFLKGMNVGEFNMYECLMKEEKAMATLFSWGYTLEEMAMASMTGDSQHILKGLYKSMEFVGQLAYTCPDQSK